MAVFIRLAMPEIRVDKKIRVINEMSVVLSVVGLNIDAEKSSSSDSVECED